MYFDKSTMTVAGRTLLTRATAGSEIVWGRAACFTDQLTDAGAATTTAFTGDCVCDGNAVAAFVAANVNTSVTATMDNSVQGCAAGYARSFGLWAKISGDADWTLALVAYSSDGTVAPPSYFPAYDGTGESLLRAVMEFSVIVSDGVVSTIQPSSQQFALAQDLQTEISTRSAFDERCVTTHAAGSTTTGDDQWIYGFKSFVSGIRIGKEPNYPTQGLGLIDGSWRSTAEGVRRNLIISTEPDDARITLTNDDGSNYSKILMDAEHQELLTYDGEIKFSFGRSNLILSKQVDSDNSEISSFVYNYDTRIDFGLFDTNDAEYKFRIHSYDTSDNVLTDVDFDYINKFKIALYDDGESFCVKNESSNYNLFEVKRNAVVDKWFVCAGAENLEMDELGFHFNLLDVSYSGFSIISAANEPTQAIFSVKQRESFIRAYANSTTIGGETSLQIALMSDYSITSSSTATAHFTMTSLAYDGSNNRIPGNFKWSLTDPTSTTSVDLTLNKGGLTLSGSSSLTSDVALNANNVKVHNLILVPDISDPVASDPATVHQIAKTITTETDSSDALGAFTLSTVEYQQSRGTSSDARSISILSKVWEYSSTHAIDSSLKIKTACSSSIEGATIYLESLSGTPNSQTQIILSAGYIEAYGNLYVKGDILKPVGSSSVNQDIGSNSLPFRNVYAKNIHASSDIYAIRVNASYLNGVAAALYEDETADGGLWFITVSATRGSGFSAETLSIKRAERVSLNESITSGGHTHTLTVSCNDFEETMTSSHEFILLQGITLSYTGSSTTSDSKQVLAMLVFE